MKLKTLVGLSLITIVTSLASAAHAQTYNVIYDFTGGPEGTHPFAGLTLRGSLFYGTTNFGANNNNGAVYLFSKQGSNWVTTPLYFFRGFDGSGPTARVVFGPDGHLYGTTSAGGSYGYGTVFELIPILTTCTTANCTGWKENMLYSFLGGIDGADPHFGDLTFDKQGNIYGTTYYGGTNDGGTVFQLRKAGNNWIKTILYSFNPKVDGGNPANGVVIDSKGNLFGTIQNNSVFELTYIPQVGWQETVLHTFQGVGDVRAGLVFDSSGNLYGATTGTNGNGGAVYELSPSGDTWTYTQLYLLSGNGCGPDTDLTLDGAGNIYGISTCNGQFNYGNVFKLTNTQNGWVYTSLHDFAGGFTDGRLPMSNVTIDTNGNLWGTTLAGGFTDDGIVWEIMPQ